jgi:hypothetical protein
MPIPAAPRGRFIDLNQGSLLPPPPRFHAERANPSCRNPPCPRSGGSRRPKAPAGAAEGSVTAERCGIACVRRRTVIRYWRAAGQRAGCPPGFGRCLRNDCFPGRCYRNRYGPVCPGHDGSGGAGGFTLCHCYRLLSDMEPLCVDSWCFYCIRNDKTMPVHAGLHRSAGGFPLCRNRICVMPANARIHALCLPEHPNRPLSPTRA